MAGMKFIAKHLIQGIEGSNKNGHCFQNFWFTLINQCERSSKNTIVWNDSNEAICYPQILIYSLEYCFFDSLLFYIIS